MPGGRRQQGRSGVAVLVALLLSGSSSAWIYPEHRDIMAKALQDLPADQQRFFAELWTQARSGNESRYCQDMVTGDGRTAPVCLDLAAWPAIAGDHSCSPNKFLSQTLPSNWILNVGKVAAETKVGLEKAHTRDATLNEWAISNLKLQYVDSDYVGRAAANNSHFLIPRTSNSLEDYLVTALAEGAEPNALGLYLYYHLGALGLAQQWAAATDAAARAALARQVLATEAFAIHFLEDSYSSGHVAGTWGNSAERKGTHDYYCEFGLDTASWAGTPMVLLGDAHMRPQDLSRTAQAVAQSLKQVFEAADSGPAATAARAVDPKAATDAAAFDSCTATKQPSATVTAKTLPTALPVVRNTPIAGRGEGDVHVPHFRQEIGPFVGFSGDLTGGVAFGGYQSGNANARPYGGAEIEFRVGVGLEALTGSTGAGQAFLGVGYSYDAPQDGTTSNASFNSAGVPLVPARRGITLRLRVPFYLIPFDLLLVAPILAWASPSAMTDMGIVAASGGLLRYERAFNTPIGAFQLLIGREVAATFWGYAGDNVQGVGIIAPGATVPYNSDLVFLSYRVLGLDFPTFEYRPLREFATNQALTFAIQFGWGVEFPNQVGYQAKLTLPAATGPTPTLATSWFIYMRIHFDARYYF
jgi:hypothetical protein